MATLYFKAAGGNFNGANWSTTSAAGVDSNTPTAADNCIVELASGAMTINSGSVCRSLDFTSGTSAYTGTATHTSGVALTIGDGTAGAGNVALKLASGMTYTLGSATTSSITFGSTSATQQTITTNGKTLGNVTMNGAGSSYQLVGTTTSSGTITWSQGTWDWNNVAISAVAISVTGASGRTLTPGSSAVTLTGSGASIWNASNCSNLTISSNTAVITMSGVAAGFTSSTTVSINWNGMGLVFTGSGISAISGIAGQTTTFANVTRTGTAAKTEGLAITGSLTCSSAFTMTANSDVNRIFVTSGAVGTTSTITAATFTASGGIDFMDITGAGAATWTAAGSGATYLGDAQGNSGITFATPATQTFSSGTKNYSDVTVWTSRVPLPQDDVIINTTTATTLTADMPRLGKNVNFTTFNKTFTFNTSLTVFGSLTLSSGMTYTQGNTRTLTFGGRDVYTFTSAGQQLSSQNNGGVIMAAPGGQITQQDALTISTGIAALTNGFTLTAGTWIDAGFTVTGTNVSISGTITRALTKTATWNLNGTASGNVWNATTTTGLTYSDTAGSITLNTAFSSARTFVGGGLTYGTITYTVAASPGSLTITGANYIDTLTIGTGRILTYPASTVTTVKNHTVSGAVFGYQRMAGLNANYVSVPDSAALSITSDITLLARVALDDWTPVGAAGLVAKYGSASTRSYLLDINTAGNPRLTVSSDGSTATVATSSATTGFTDGTTNWILATWRASDGRTQFFTASGSIANPVASDFSQLGTNQTAAAGSIFDSTSVVEVGSTTLGTSLQMIGNMYRAKIYNGLFSTSAFGGTVQLDTDFVSKTVGNNTFTESSSNAATVTINGPVAQAGDGRVSVVSSSAGTLAVLDIVGAVPTMDYLVVQDIFSGIPYKFYAGVNSVSVSGNTGISLLAKVTQPYMTWLSDNATATATSGTATLPFSATAAAGDLLLFGFVAANTDPGTITSAPSGYTQVASNPSKGTTQAYNYLYYKVATGGETAATISWTNSVSSQVNLAVISGWVGTATQDVNDKNNSGSSSVANLTTGSGVSNTTTTAYALAQWAGSSTFGASVSITGSFQEARGVSGTANWLRMFGLPLLATGSQTGTFTWTTSRVASSQLVVFKDVVATSTGNFLAFF